MAKRETKTQREARENRNREARARRAAKKLDAMDIANRLDSGDELHKMLELLWTKQSNGVF